MAYLTKKKVKEIIQKAPKGTSPEGIIAGLRARGHQLEGYEQSSAEIPSSEPQKGIVQKFGDAATDVLKGVAKGVGSTIYNVGKLGLQRDKVIGLDKLYGSPEIPTEKPDILKPKGTAQKVGFVTEQAAEFLIPSSAIAKGEKAIQATTKAAANAGKITPFVQKALNVAGGATLEGAGATAVSQVQTGDTKEALKTGVTAGVLSVPFKIFGQVKEPVANTLKKSAEKKSAQALGATTKTDKALSEKIVPELLKRKIKFATRGGLMQKAQSGIDEVGGQLEDAYSALPPDTKIDIAPVIKRLEDFKDRFITTGTGGQRVVVDSAGYKAAQELQDTIIKLAQDPQKLITNSNISITSLRKARQILDSSISRTGKGFALGARDSATLAAQKEGANAIRNELAQAFPHIDKINKEFTFWKNVETVISNTVQRTQSQATPLGETIAEGAGAVIGASKGGFGNVILGAIGYKLLKKVITSPGWRQTSAVVRTSLADALMRGNKEQALNILNRLVVGLAKGNKN